MAQFQDEDHPDLDTDANNHYWSDSESVNSFTFGPLLEIDHTLIWELDNLPNLPSCPQSKPWPTVTSVVSGAIYGIFTYIISIIIAAYMVVQAMEAVSFVVSQHGGLVFQVAWLCSLSAAAVLAALLVEDLVFEPAGLHLNFPFHL
jgi:hypothetical protein